jgi:hypothetical protein
MRRIQIEEGLWIRFPKRDAAFAEGVEIGALAACMAMALPEFRRTISADAFEQARALAGKLGYRAVPGNDGPFQTMDVTFTTRRERPKLRLVCSNG